MGMALRAITDDGNLLALDQIYVSVAVVINAHGSLPYLRTVVLGGPDQAGPQSV